MAGSNNSPTLGARPAGWRNIFTNPLNFKKSDETPSVKADGSLSSDSINAIIEGEIIPRLLMAHSVDSGSGQTHRDREIAPGDALDFARLPLRLEVATLMREVDKFLDQGVSVEAILLDLLAPAARRLGEMWESDECDFVDVTMGLWRLQEVMREISHRSPAIEAIDPSEQKRSLFAPVPGDQHQFGALMLDEIFARAGWKSEVLQKPERRELLDRLSHQSFDLVGLTISRDCTSAAVTNLIKAMRSVSANPNITVIIGGNRVNQNPTIVAETGADGTGADAHAALEVAERLVQSAPVRAHNVR